MSVDLDALEQQYSLPSGLLSAVQQQESGGDPDAVSPKGAVGSFQFMPATAKQYGIDPTDPDQAAKGAAMMFSDLSDKYNGDVPSMLAAYNWGQGNVDRKGLENAPAETQNYIKSVTSQLGKGTQYAAADTGNMSDATVDNNIPDLSKMSDADLDALEAKAKGAQTPDLSKMSDADLDALEAKIKGGQQPQGLIDALKNPPDTSFVSNYGQGFLDTANRARLGIEGLGQAVGKALYGANPQDAAEEASRKASLAQLDKEKAASGVQPSGFWGGAGNIAGSIAGNPASWLPMGEISGVGDLARAGAIQGGATGLIQNTDKTNLGNNLANAAIGAGEGAATTAVVGQAGKNLLEIPSGIANRVKGAFGIDTADEIATQSEKNWDTASQSFKDVDATGATLTPEAGQKILSDVKNAVGNLNSRHSDTQAELDAFEKAVNSGNMTLSKLDEFRQNFADVISDNTKSKIDGGGLYSDGQKAFMAKKAIMDSFDTLGDNDFSVGNAGAAQTLKQGINQWAQASRYDRIADIINNAGGDAAKLKQGFTKFLKNDANTRGFNDDEIAALQDAATRGTGENIERALGAFGFDFHRGVGNVIPAITSGTSAVIPGGLPLAATGTALRQTGKYAARGKAQTALDMVMNWDTSAPLKVTVTPADKLPDVNLPRLALPAPEVTNVVNTYGQNVQTTPASREIIGQSPSTVSEQTPAQVAASNEIMDRGVSKMIKKLGNKRISDYDEGHAKGGIIKNREIHLSKKLEVKLGRKPKAREVELASYVGAHGVHRLLNQKDVSMPAHKMFPEATVKEKRELFFNKKKPYTVEQIKKALV
jgi:Transglycosylase SLT domain